MAAPSRGGVCAEQTGHQLREQSQADAKGTRLQPRGGDGCPEPRGRGVQAGQEGSEPCWGCMWVPVAVRDTSSPRRGGASPPERGVGRGAPSGEESGVEGRGEPGRAWRQCLFSLALEPLNLVQRDDLTSTSASGVCFLGLERSSESARGRRRPTPGLQGALSPPPPETWVLGPSGLLGWGWGPRTGQSMIHSPSCPADSRSREPSSDALGLSQPPRSGQGQKWR